MGTAMLIILWLGTGIPFGRVLARFTELLPINTIGLVVLALEFAVFLLSIRILQTATIPRKRSRKESR